MAAASYSESLKQFAAVVENYLEYEPDILAYRMEKLKEMIAETNEKLTASDHEITMLYFDAIEMIEKGEMERLQVKDFGEAFKKMREAQHLIEEVISKRPDEFSVAMKSQSDRIQSNIDWLTLQLGYENRTKVYYVASAYRGSGSTRMSGTTEFVKEADLPAFSEDDEKEPFQISNALFPSLAKVESAVEPAPVPTSDSRPRFSSSKFPGTASKLAAASN